MHCINIIVRETEYADAETNIIYFESNNFCR